MPLADKDRPSTWIKYKDGLCNGCQAGCCTMPLEVKIDDLIRLQLVTEDEASGSLKKVAKRLEKEGFIRSFRAQTGLFMLAQKANDDCLFLNEKRLCSVYDKRPEVCRKFPSIGPKPGYCPARRQK